MSMHEQPAAPWDIAAVLVVALVLAVAGRTQAQTGTGVATYQVFAQTPGSQPLCPYEDLVIKVGVLERTTRSGATGVVHLSRFMPWAVVTPIVADRTIGTVNTALVGTGGTPGPQGGFYGLVTFTALKIGQTTIDFTGWVNPNINVPISSGGGPVTAAPAPPLQVAVDCKYSISLYSVWRLPGERILDVLGVVQSANLIPNASGRFSTTATMSSTAAWIGPCPGASRIQRSQVTIYGDVKGMNIKVLYAPASTKTTEGCMGRSNTGRGQPDPLDLVVASTGGAVLHKSHVLRTYVNAVGNTTVVLKRIP